MDSSNRGNPLSPNCCNATQQLIGSHAAFPLVTIDFFAVDRHGHVSGAAGLDAGFDSELGLRGFLQAHGRAAQIHSKETALDFDVHRDHLLALIVLQSGPKNAIQQWETRNSFFQTLPITAMTLDHGDLKYASLATGSPQGDESGEAGLKT
jgi:hypothetical protein